MPEYWLHNRLLWSTPQNVHPHLVPAVHAHAVDHLQLIHKVAPSEVTVRHRLADRQRINAAVTAEDS